MSPDSSSVTAVHLLLTNVFIWIVLSGTSFRNFVHLPFASFKSLHHNLNEIYYFMLIKFMRESLRLQMPVNKYTEISRLNFSSASVKTYKAGKYKVWSIPVLFFYFCCQKVRSSFLRTFLFSYEYCCSNLKHNIRSLIYFGFCTWKSGNVECKTLNVFLLLH